MEGEYFDHVIARPVRMSLRKRLRIIRAAFSQEWREETCIQCERAYWTQAAVPRPTVIECPECETRAFAAYLNTLEVTHKEIA